MTTLSPGLLYSAQKLLEAVSSHSMSRDEFLWAFRTILVSPADGVLALSTRCGWIGINENLGLEVTNVGRTVQMLTTVEDKLRQQIKDFIQAVQPAWAKLLSAGRSESIPFMPEAVRQCFTEAGLGLFPPSDAIVSWWDNLAASARGQIADSLANIGRRGERSSIIFETQRVKFPPKWQSIESNRSGFDLLSKVAATNSSDLQIEVKASERPVSSATFHITRNEWEVAVKAERYVFHVWSFSEKSDYLAIITPAEIESHMPMERGNGKWECVEIPFRVFASNFVMVNV